MYIPLVCGHCICMNYWRDSRQGVLKKQLDQVSFKCVSYTFEADQCLFVIVKFSLSLVST